MEKFMKILGCIFALIGFAYVVKQIMHYCKERCYLCGLQKTKEEEKKEKPTGTTASYKIKVEEEKRQGSRYGSNPIRY